MINDKVKSKLVKIAKKYDLLLLILFGSRADNNNRNNSDWDFAFLSKNEFDSKKYFKLFGEISNLFEENVDLINLNEQDDPLLKKEIFSKGICIYEKRKNLFDDLLTQVWFEYIDYQPFFKEFEKVSKLKTKKLLNELNEI